MTFISLGFAVIPFLRFILTIFNTGQESPVSVDRSTTIFCSIFVNLH